MYSALRLPCESANRRRQEKKSTIKQPVRRQKAAAAERQEIKCLNQRLKGIFYNKL
jgi:hypothetical protein